MRLSNFIKNIIEEHKRWLQKTISFEAVEFFIRQLELCYMVPE